jgi:muconolactone delta-isomerase
VEFLVEFDVRVPDGAPETEVEERVRAEASPAAKLANEAYLVRLWKPRVAPGEAKASGLFRRGRRGRTTSAVGEVLLDCAAGRRARILLTRLRAAIDLVAARARLTANPSSGSSRRNHPSCSTARCWCEPESSR